VARKPTNTTPPIEPDTSLPPWARRAERHHYAFTVKKVPGGYELDNVMEYGSRGEADQAMLRLTGRYGDAAESISLDRPLQNGEILEPALLKR
jgi:hypothetical protein